MNNVVLGGAANVLMRGINAIIAYVPTVHNNA